MGWRTRLRWGTPILLVQAVPRLSSAGFVSVLCSLAQRTKCWNAFGFSPAASAVPQHPHLEIFRVSLQRAWMDVSLCSVRVPQSSLPPPELLRFQMSETLCTLRSVQQLCSGLS